MDWTAFARSYSPQSRQFYQRLLHIVKVRPEWKSQIHRQLLAGIAADAQSFLDVQLYKDLCQALDVDTTDDENVAKMQRVRNQSQEKLDAELRQLRSQPLTPDVRDQTFRCCRALVDLCLNCGAFQSASKYLVMARDFMPHGKDSGNPQIDLGVEAATQLYWDQVKMGMYQLDWASVLTGTMKLEQLPTVSGDSHSPQLKNQVKCCLALVHLANSDYHLTAQCILGVPFSREHRVSDFLANSDIALIGSLCALATMDRAAIRSKVHDGPTFKPFLEYEPAIRDILSNFLQLDFQSVFKSLDQLKETLLLDLFLHPHIDNLFKLIKQRSVVQYLSIYDTVDMRRMAEILCFPNVDELRNMVADLITVHRLPLRIDLEKMCLSRCAINELVDMEDRVDTAVTKYQFYMEELIFTTLLRKNKLVTK